MPAAFEISLRDLFMLIRLQARYREAAAIPDIDLLLETLCFADFLKMCEASSTTEDGNLKTSAASEIFESAIDRLLSPEDEVLILLCHFFILWAFILL